MRTLQQRYSGVVATEGIEASFSEERTVDLCKIVKSSTEWPTCDHSIKTLVKYLNFK